MVEREAVEDQRAALGYEHAIVHEIFGRAVWCSVPEWRMHTEHLLDNRADVWKILLVVSIRPALASHDGVQFLVCANLHVRMFADESKEPLDDSRSLEVT